MAPEFPYLRTNGTYLDYINALEGYYDFIAPQYYTRVATVFGWTSSTPGSHKITTP